MGLAFSLNRQRRSLESVSLDTEKRTFEGTSRLVKLVKIYDGDTFTVITRLTNSEPWYRYQLRLSGIDTPELKPTMSTPHRTEHIEAGEKVRDVLKGLYPNGTIFLVDFEKEDKYGRLLGTVWTTKKRFFGLGKVRKDRNVCNWLLFKAYALPYDGGSKVDFTLDQLNRIREL